MGYFVFSLFIILGIILFVLFCMMSIQCDKYKRSGDLDCIDCGHYDCRCDE